MRAITDDIQEIYEYDGILIITNLGRTAPLLEAESAKLRIISSHSQSRKTQVVKHTLKQTQIQTCTHTLIHKHMHIYSDIPHI